MATLNGTMTSRVSDMSNLRAVLAQTGDNHPRLKQHRVERCKLKQCALCLANESLDMFEFVRAGGDEATYAQIRVAAYQKKPKPQDRLKNSVKNAIQLSNVTSAWREMIPEEEESAPFTPPPPVKFARTPSPSPGESPHLTQEMKKTHNERMKQVRLTWDMQQVEQENQAVRRALKQEIRSREASKPTQRGLYMPPPPPATQNDFLLAILRLQKLEANPALRILASEPPSKLRTACMSVPTINMEPSARDRYPADKITFQDFQELMWQVYPSVGEEDLTTLATMFERDNDDKVPLWDVLLAFNHVWRALTERDPLALLHYYADLVQWDAVQCRARNEQHGPYVHLLDLRLLCSILAGPLEGTAVQAALDQDVFTLKADKQGQVLISKFHEVVAANRALAEAFAPHGVTQIQEEWRAVKVSRHTKLTANDSDDSDDESDRLPSI